MLVSCCLHKFLKLHVSQTCFLLLIFLLRGLFVLNRCFSRFSSMFKAFSLGCLVVGSWLIRKKRKISRNDHSLLLVVICCHSLYHSLPFVITCSHLLSFVVPLVVTCCLLLVVTRFITRLSFYKISCIPASY